jgi:Protein of unknown function (DUF993)
MNRSIKLPAQDGRLEIYQLNGQIDFPVCPKIKCRSVFAAAHVVADESARSVLHLCELFRLADQAGLLGDIAVERMERFLALAGV